MQPKLLISIGILLLGHRAVISQDSDVPRTGIGAAIAMEEALVASIAKAEKSVVAIARGRQGQQDVLQNPQFVPHEYTTGIVVDKNGLILTNYHALGDVNRDKYVVWVAGKAYDSVRVKAADPWTDLAVLETDAKELVPIELGDAKNLKKGRIVIALGNPHGIARDGHVSATWGIVSNLQRKIDGPLLDAGQPTLVANKDRETRYHYGALIQTDAKLVRGTSGGPLLTLDGKMVGLTTNIAMLAGFEKGTGYAIPVDDTFRRVVAKLKRGEEIEQGFLGVAPRNPIADYGEVGVVLERVELGTAAGLAGLMDQDEVREIDGHPIRTIDDLFLRIGSLPPEHTAEVAFRRQQRDMVLLVPLMKKSAESSRQVIATARTVSWRGMQVDYSTALSTNKVVGGLDPQGSIAVKSVEADSPAWKAGLRRGVLVSHVNNQRVRKPRDFHEAVRDQDGVVKLVTFDLNGRSILVVDPPTDTTSP